MPGEPKTVSYRLTSSEWPDVLLPVGHARAVETLNEPYHVRMAIAATDPDADLPAMLGKDCVLEMVRAETASRRFCGLVREVVEGERTGDAPIADIEVVPALFFLTQRRDTRIFQDKSVPEILEEVLAEALKPYGREASNQLDETYPTREYCVQYRETDFAFVHRLMEEEGIGYTFDHDGDVELMVLRDRNSAYPEVASGKTIEFHPENAEITDTEPVSRFEVLHRPRTSAVVARDWDWTQGGVTRVEAEAPGEGPDGRVRESYEHGRARSLTIHSYDQGVRRYQDQDSTRQAPLRQEAHQWDARVGIVVSRVVSITAGARFELTGHPQPGIDGEYLITRCTHASEPLGAAIAGAGSSDPYHNTLECIPIEVAYRPERRTPKPRIASVQTAVVTGPSGEEIHVDEHGRIRVQFHWDRDGQLDENSTCWVRVQQPWAGAGWGFWWVPRMGMEVACHFVNGDPDRPLVSAASYNGQNPTPYALPAEKTKSTIKSDSSLGHSGFSGQGFNEFRFEDKHGEEEIFTHAEKDYNEVVENDHNTLVHHDQTNTVDNDQTQLVKNNQTETVDNDQTMTIDVNRSVTVHTDYDETVDKTETRHTVGDVTEDFDANERRSISLSVTETVDGNETRSITGNQTESITANHTVSITGSSTEDVVGTWSRSVTAGITTTTPAAYAVTTAGGYTATAAAGIKMIATAGMQIVGPGGVTRVDSEWIWCGGKKMCVGSNYDGAFVMKFGLCNNAFAFIGLKVEETGLDIHFKPFNMSNKNTDMEADGVKMKTAGADIDGASELKTG